jgi:hypothetical protein
MLIEPIEPWSHPNILPWPPLPDRNHYVTFDGGKTWVIRLPDGTHVDPQPEPESESNNPL